MRIGVPRELKDQEYRVGLTPSSVSELVHRGHEILVETGAGLGSGLTDAEAGLRLRYEISREFAPYVGASWERSFGDTARYSRAAGEGTGGFSVVAGIRAWF